MMYPPSLNTEPKSNSEAAPPIELTGKYQSDMLSFSTKNNLFLNSATWIKFLVAMCVMDGELVPLISPHVVPL
jgi:hypothetical protein